MPYLIALIILVTGCSFVPRRYNDAVLSAKNEQSALNSPSVSEILWREYLSLGFKNNGNLRAATLEWLASLERVRSAGAYPNTKLGFGVDYMLSPSMATSFDRTSIRIMPSSMEDLLFPSKVVSKSKFAMAKAEAAYANFLSQKFSLQKDILTHILDIEINTELIDIENEWLKSLSILRAGEEGRVRLGASSSSALLAQSKELMAMNSLGHLQASKRSSKRLLMGLTNVKKEEEIPDSFQMISSNRKLKLDESNIFNLTIDSSPYLKKLRAEAASDREVLSLAKQEFIPDLNPSFMATGSATRAVGAMLMLPFNLSEIFADINASTHRRDASLARLSQGEHRQVNLALKHYILAYDANRQAEFLNNRVLPLLKEALASILSRYSQGEATLELTLMTQDELFNLERMITKTKRTYHLELFALEKELGSDLELLKGETNESKI